MVRGVLPSNSMPVSISSNIIKEQCHGRICTSATGTGARLTPGELLREDVIPATGKTRSEIAALLGISRQHLYDIHNERKPVSPTVAVRLGKLLGDGAGSGRECRAHMILGMRNANCPTRSEGYPQSEQRWREKMEATRAVCERSAAAGEVPQA
jgi:addiction module HigA family antidote